ncbi:MAG: UDP-3-O-(3-hydroxymyristoyl)glucosamine N-acyltransferase [Luteibaculaceae bacterium]
MRLQEAKTLREIASFLGASFYGEPNHKITGINEIHVVEPGDLVFVDHPKYYEKALNSAATTILINKEVEFPEGKAILVSADPFKDFNKLTKHFGPERLFSAEPSYQVGENTTLAPNVVIGEQVKIGSNCKIGPNVVIYQNTVIGDNVIIHAGAIIGGDAFYYQKREGVYHKMHTCGRVVIENDVEIGAATTIDRGVTGDTTIGAGTKIDNHVHIGHDTQVGKNCLFAAQVGIAGCVVIRDNVVLWGQVGVPSDLEIGDGAVVLGQSGLTKDLEGGKTYFGSPAEEARKKFTELAMIRKLPELIKKLQ